tara:strand:- start:1620 stop:1949 length:330 start_codon:yes stop_codon:yes gene_type:complete
MNLLRKDMEEQAFFLEIQRLSIEMDRVIEKYDMRDRVVSIMVTGILDTNIFGDMRLKAIYSYSLESPEELDNVVNFINNTWNDPEEESQDQFYKDIDDLLDGTGIELED